MRQNLNSIANHLWRMTEKIHQPFDKRHALDFYFNKRPYLDTLIFVKEHFIELVKKIKQDLS